MKRKTILFTLLFILASCNNTSGASTPVSPIPPTSIIEPSTSHNTSDVPSIGDSTSPSTSITQPSTSTSTSTSTSVAPKPTELTIKEALTLGNTLSDNTVGDLVKIKATYIKKITLSRTSEDLMYFADNDSSIYLRVNYTDFKGYLNNRYVNNEYYVTANISKNNSVVELKYNTTLGAEASVTNIYNVDPSVNLENISESKDSIHDLVSDFNAIPLDKKKCGTGKIVTIIGQVLETEYTDANTKAILGDGTGVITVISEQKFVTHASDIGKYYAVTGILNIQVTSPALLYLSSSYVTPSDATIEESIDVSNAKVVAPDFLKTKYVLGDKYYSPTIEEYMTLYSTSGYIVDNTRYSEYGNYHLGIAAENNGSLISDKTAGNSNSVKGLFLMNHYNIDERSLSYSPFANYFATDTKVEEMFFTIHQFNSQEHGWKVFPIEALVEPLEVE